LGDTFLRSFISIYDFENKRIGLAPHINSKATITKRPMKPWLIAVISVSSVLILVIIIVVIVKIRKNRNAKKIQETKERNDSLINGTIE